MDAASKSRQTCEDDCLANDQRVLIKELVLRNLEIVRCRPTPNAAAAVIMRAVARAEPSMKVASVGNWHTSKVRAHAQAHHPLQAHEEQ
jgi:hypothetical protein